MDKKVYCYLKFNIVRTCMKVVSSLKSLKKRDKDCQIVKRRGKIFVINKKNKRFKAKQG